jgi:hypothetical protein
MAKRIKILFIMFQGSGTNLKNWNETTKSKFLDRLKTIGKVYTYQDSIYNIHHYDKSNPEHNDFDSNLDINLSYVNPNTHIKMVYSDILKTAKLQYKNIDEYKFIPIGWSMGGLMALYFAQVYSQQCIHVILLDSVLFTPNNMKKYIDVIYKSENLDKIYPITNAKYKKMLLAWKENHNDINDMWKINGIQNYIRWVFMSKHLNNLKLPVPTTAFVNMVKLERSEWSKEFNNKRRLAEVKILEKNNPSNYKAIIFNDKSHYIFDKIQPANIIIKEIKKILYKVPTKKLYHGSPYLLKELIPMLPRGTDDFNSQTAVYLSTRIKDSC